MTDQERIEANKEKNKPFVTAFKFFADILTEGSQKGLCELMGIPSSRVSEYNKGKKPVSEEAIDALIRVSVEHDKQIYREYLYGNSDIMLLANVTDEDIAEAEMRKNNPDYDVMQQRRKETEQQLNELLAHHPASVSQSGANNADIMEIYAQRIRLVDDLRTSLREELAEVRTIRTELQQARDDFRDAAYRLTQALRTLNNQQSINIGLAAEV